MENDLETSEKIELCPISHIFKNRTRFGHTTGVNMGTNKQ